MAEHQFVKMPHAVIDHADLDLHEFAVYIALLRFRNPKTGTCFPGLQTIADTARMSRNSASRTVGRLEDRGIIKVERVKAAGSKTNASNKYTVGLLSEDPFKYMGKSAKGQRVPKRELSQESRERLSAAAHRRGRTSEALPATDDSSSSASEVLRSASEVLGVVPPRVTKKTKEKKTNQEDITPTFSESGLVSVSFEASDDDPATDNQVAYLKDLAIHQGYAAGYGAIPDDLTLARWRKMTRLEAHNLIRGYLKSLGRPDDIYYPEYGTPEYAALSSAGQEFADSAGDPASVFEYGFKMKENSA